MAKSFTATQRQSMGQGEGLTGLRRAGLAAVWLGGAVEERLPEEGRRGDVAPPMTKIFLLLQKSMKLQYLIKGCFDLPVEKIECLFVATQPPHPSLVKTKVLKREPGLYEIRINLAS
eukprot:TRINITY_DN8087_c0_g1_i3.p1 TRINITY_DN8087_c0_g1~~TRINITY_DN8087_c0_g1_i3.p1  ORF type:complete len:117 (+),score=24.55 TRINITY_DN8087_c0_g1_i3:103-453(+)